MTHTDAIHAIPPDRRAALLRRSNGAGLRHLAGHLGLLVLTGWVIMTQPPLWWAALPVHGILLVFLFTLQHECTHQTPFATPWLNEVVGHFCGLVLIQPFLWFRYFHLAHHRHTNDPEHDPELAGGGKPDTLPAWLWHVSGLPLWSWMIRQLFTSALGRARAPYLPARAAGRVKAEARLMLLAYAAIIVLFGPALLWLWIIPALLGQPFLRLYLLAEHGRCAYVSNMLENTRTTFTNRIVRFLAWNMPYHIEHHSLPNVPFHHLPALHDDMRAHLGVTAVGYAAFTADYLRKMND